ncbi:Exc2 family lipoprotein, partial [Klebsiella pneumoniae]|uniref:Exc2 family lipoprotein n=2 Tax=Klebsiella pneumoniae TaxID=573 RepID=UPI002165705E
MRRSGSKLCLIAMITATATLTACAPKGSVEQHTRHYVYASDDGFDPNFSTQKADTTRMMVPFFRQFWDMGAKDKATGKSRSDVQQRIQQFGVSLEIGNFCTLSALFNQSWFVRGCFCVSGY